MYGMLLLLHILGATIWTGGHLVLALTVLPRALKQKSPSELLRFESGYERIGIPALLIQVATGLSLAYRMVPDVSQWFDFGNPVSRLIALKLLLLTITVAFAADARLRVIPRLSEDNLPSLAWHIIPVTAVSVLFVFVGVSFRIGWLY
ncbi:MAG: copper resistance protein CopD [Candidatus Manganitrophaceae bacterium]|nr:MAG: copper resistance protein CopD [Candidatus Manganitrophaceae bacterium]